MSVISDRSDQQLSALLSAKYPGAAFNAFLTAVKTRLDNDATIQQFRVANGGEYTHPHVAQAVTRTRGV